MPSPDNPIPVGCSGSPKLGFSERFNPERTLRQLHRQDQSTKTIFWTGLALPLRKFEGFDFALNDIDTETGLSRMVLLASGSQNIKEGNISLVSSSRLGLAIQDEIFAIGSPTQLMGDHESPEGLFFGFEVQRKKRTASGRFIGIIINSEHEGFKNMRTKHEGDDTELELQGEKAMGMFQEMSYQAVNAVIEAEKQLRRYQASDIRVDLLSQAQIDLALDWLAVGEKAYEFDQPSPNTALDVRVTKQIN